MMNLDRPLMWQKYTATPDNFGQQIEDWTDHKMVWGHILPRRGYEGYEADQKVAIENTLFIVRFDEDWLPKDRLLIDDEVYEITNISEYVKTTSFSNSREHFLQLSCVYRDSDNTGRDGD